MADPNSWNFLDGAFVVIIDLAFVGYLLTSELVRNVFKDFPSSTKNNREEVRPRKKMWRPDDTDERLS